MLCLEEDRSNCKNRSNEQCERASKGNGSWWYDNYYSNGLE